MQFCKGRWGCWNRKIKFVKGFTFLNKTRKKCQYLDPKSLSMKSLSNSIVKWSSIWCRLVPDSYSDSQTKLLWRSIHTCPYNSLSHLQSFLFSKAPWDPMEGICHLLAILFACWAYVLNSDEKQILIYHSSLVNSSFSSCVSNTALLYRRLLSPVTFWLLFTASRCGRQLSQTVWNTASPAAIPCTLLRQTYGHREKASNLYFSVVKKLS